MKVSSLYVNLDLRGTGESMTSEPSLGVEKRNRHIERCRPY
jgi:hypothetical protein